MRSSSYKNPYEANKFRDVGIFLLVVIVVSVFVLVGTRQYNSQRKTTRPAETTKTAINPVTKNPYMAFGAELEASNQKVYRTYMYIERISDSSKMYRIEAVYFGESIEKIVGFTQESDLKTWYEVSVCNFGNLAKNEDCRLVSTEEYGKILTELADKTYARYYFFNNTEDMYKWTSDTHGKIADYLNEVARRR